MTREIKTEQIFLLKKTLNLAFEKGNRLTVSKKHMELNAAEPKRVGVLLIFFFFPFANGSASNS